MDLFCLKINDTELNNIVDDLYVNLNSLIESKIPKNLNFSLKNKLKPILQRRLINKFTQNFDENQSVTELEHDFETDLKQELLFNLEIELNKQIFTAYFAETNYKSILNNETLYLIDKNIENLFDIDINFIKQGYNLYTYSNTDIIKYVQDNNYINHIFHPKQLYNIFNDKIQLLVNEKKQIYVKYNEKYDILNNFIKTIEQSSYNTLKHLIIKKVKNCNFTDNNLLLLVYIGCEKDITSTIINSIKTYYNIEKFSLAFCVNYKLINSVIPLLETNFDTNFIIYSSTESGNDIVPSLLVYDDIIKTYNFNYVIKIHTKNDKTFLNNATGYLLNTSLNDLLLKQNVNSSSIGFEYTINTDDFFNKNLYLQYKDTLINNEFVHGTIFLTTKNVIYKVLQFLKDNYKIILFQNMYDNNCLNKDYSYVHFMERLFGYV
jgi:hypothetical protein